MSHACRAQQPTRNADGEATDDLVSLEHLWCSHGDAPGDVTPFGDHQPDALPRVGAHGAVGGRHAIPLLEVATPRSARLLFGTVAVLAGCLLVPQLEAVAWVFALAIVALSVGMLAFLIVRKR